MISPYHLHQRMQQYLALALLFAMALALVLVIIKPLIILWSDQSIELAETQALYERLTSEANPLPQMQSRHRMIMDDPLFKDLTPLTFDDALKQLDDHIAVALQRHHANLVENHESKDILSGLVQRNISLTIANENLPALLAQLEQLSPLILIMQINIISGDQPELPRHAVEGNQLTLLLSILRLYHPLEAQST